MGGRCTRLYAMFKPLPRSSTHGLHIKVTRICAVKQLVERTIIATHGWHIRAFVSGPRMPPMMKPKTIGSPVMAAGWRFTEQLMHVGRSWVNHELPESFEYSHQVILFAGVLSELAPTRQIADPSSTPTCPIKKSINQYGTI